ncbi:hypothetical protein OF829_17235 [Sphingomonas sp. LB-2]|uniref:hypothetical protein n=1 Tax=Sphingomonas caeni TaxID=2984949 RepID=UPI00222E65F0|nr:hypothetical protein [Sphingomonas caeni]MCW3848985.1 hypothetical protein [Sphingomonas caeni]
MADPLASANLRRWIVACAIGELLGIACAALWWVAIDRIDPEPVALGARLAMLALKSLSGLVEGWLLGTLQARALAHFYPRLSRSAWVGATVSLALFGWAVGSSFSVFAAGPASAAPAADPGMLVTLGMAAAFGLGVGALFGAVQALVLRRAARRASWWIVFNALGWGAALPAIYLFAGIDLGIGPAGAVLNGLAGGIIAGLVLGAITGLAFRHMPAR